MAILGTQIIRSPVAWEPDHIERWLMALWDPLMTLRLGQQQKNLGCGMGFSNLRSPSSSHPKATLWSKSFLFSTSFHSKDGLYVHLGIAQKATVRILSDGVPALPSIPSSHLKPVPCLGEDMPILLSNWWHSEDAPRTTCSICNFA